MSADRFVDYDAAFAEAENARKPLTRRLFGRDWELPGVPPAAVLIRLSRLTADGRTDDDLTAGEQMLLAADMIPKNVLDEWLALGLDTDGLALILQDLMREYGKYFTGDSGGAVPEAEAPTGGAASTIYSATGVFSKPTSNATTASTSTTG